MKSRINILAAALLLAGTLDSLAVIQTLPFADGFDRPEGSLFTVGTGVWDVSGSAAGPELVVTNPATLIAPAGLTTASGKGVKWTPSGSARRDIVQFTSVSNGTLYASFLLNVVSPPSSGSRLVAYFDSSTSQPSSPQLGFFVGTSTIGIGKKASTPGATVAIGGGTHLVVVRYTFTGTTTDTVDLWLDPDNSTFGAAGAPAASTNTSGGNNVAAIPYFGIYTASGTGPSLYLDEVRIGTNWAQVTPSGGSTPPPVTALRFTHVQHTGTHIILRGTNGTAGGGYEILYATNVSSSLNQWSVVGSNNFTGTGSFDVTNPLTSGVAQAYYRIRVGGGGNGGGDTNPPANTRPSITSQPQNQSAAIGQGALFSVGATGSAPLSFQWYFNTNTLIAGATNASHLISSVVSNDVGTYSVTVANSVGSTNSLFATLTLTPSPTDGDWFVSPTGNDANPGTMALPFATLGKAVSVAQPGQTIYLRGGTYLPSATIRITNSGTLGNRISLLAYPGEKPFLDFSNQPYGDANRGLLFTTNGNHWNIKGLEIAHAGDNAVKVEASYLRFEQCVFHDNGDTGLQIGFAHETVNPGANLAAFIEVINCDSYGNYDPNSNGGDADGFAAKLHCGQGIVFMGCRAWENSDDAWDLFETDASVIITNCWAWKSAPFGQGNGNGFKLGGDGTGGQSKGTHYAYNCVAFGCKVNNFTQNSHRDGEVIINCLAFSPGNSGYNYYFEGTMNSGKQNVFKNNAGIPRSGTSGNFITDNSPLEVNNSWNLAVTVSSADFGSIVEAAAKAARQPDGSLPTGFARLVAGSDLIDKGVDVGIPFNGAAPDLGAFEYAP